MIEVVPARQGHELPFIGCWSSGGRYSSMPQGLRKRKCQLIHAGMLGSFAQT
jgi:hypothetical protein